MRGILTIVLSMGWLTVLAYNGIRYICFAGGDHNLMWVCIAGLMLAAIRR